MEVSTTRTRRRRRGVYLDPPSFRDPVLRFLPEPTPASPPRPKPWWLALFMAAAAIVGALLHWIFG